MKQAKDVGLGTVESNKVQFVTKSADGTKSTVSQEIFHSAPEPKKGKKIGGGQVLSKLAMNFNKCDGMRLEKFEADTDGTIKGSVAFTNASPGVNVSVGVASCPKEQGKGDEAKLQNCNSIFAQVEYKKDMIHSLTKVDFLKKSFNTNLMLGYENFLLGGNFDYDMKNKLKPSIVVGMNSGSNKLTVEMSDNMETFKFGAYVVPAKGIELGILSDVKMTGKDSAEAEWGTKLSGSVAACFALDDAGTSLTTTATTEQSLKTFNVGLAYSQMLRDWAKVTASGEVGIPNVNYVSFGMELELGCQ